MPCTECNDPCGSNNLPDCICPQENYTDCIIYRGAGLSCIGIQTGEKLEKALVNIDAKLCNTGGVINQNLGGGLQVYKQKDVSTGNEQFRTIVNSDDSLIISQETNEIDIKVGLESVGEVDAIDIYKGQDVNNIHQIRKIQSTSVDGTPMLTLNGDTFKVKGIKTDSLEITEDNGDILINTIEVPSTNIVTNFIVNNAYVGTEEEGNEMKPYKTIDAALTAYIGTGTILNPQFEGSTIIVKPSSQTYNFTINLAINRLQLNLTSGVNILYTGTDDYFLDTRLVTDDVNTPVNGLGVLLNSYFFNIEGSGTIDTNKGGVYAKGSGASGNGAVCTVYIEDDITIRSLYTDNGNYITNVPLKIGDPEYFTINGQPVEFYQGSSMDFPLLVTERSNGLLPNIFTETVNGFNLATTSQTTIHLKNDSWLWCKGKINFGKVDAKKYFSNFETQGTINVIVPSSTMHLVLKQGTSAFSTQKFNTEFYGNDHIESTVLINTVALGTRFNEFKIENGGTRIFIKEDNFIVVDHENSPFIVVKDLNEVATQTQQNFAINLQYNVFEPDMYENVVIVNNFLQKDVHVSIDLTRGNTKSVQNYVNGSINKKLASFANNTDAEIVLPQGSEYYNTTTNQINIVV